MTYVNIDPDEPSHPPGTLKPRLKGSRWVKPRCKGNIMIPHPRYYGMPICRLVREWSYVLTSNRDPPKTFNNPPKRCLPTIDRRSYTADCHHNRTMESRSLLSSLNDVVGFTKQPHENFTNDAETWDGKKEYRILKFMITSLFLVYSGRVRSNIANWKYDHFIVSYVLLFHSIVTMGQ